ncbi:hypothetical protein [uncultured Agrobacterium sp.]|uniref:hypothetical protein n=1 Tax=uncultured Agrobacterium sp. TaxID=157277 RepID=UPI0025FC3150|nr:hypothetical protein [uncultured Agrobacterium sp.]
MSPDILFNCCTGNAEPDWSLFDAIELGGCIMDTDDDGYVTGGIDRENAEFFTAYGHLKEGGCEAITDWHGSFDEAVATAQELSRISGLPLHIHC